MHRPVSPLLHDYKPQVQKKPKKTRALQWFVIGLGIPLLGLALISTVDMSGDGVVQATAVMNLIDSTLFVDSDCISIGAIDIDTSDTRAR